MKTKPTDKNTDETPTKSAPETPVADKACALPTEDSLAELQKLQKEIEALRKAATERDEFLKLLQRVQADFLNYQKRIKNEKECWDKYQDENLLRELLPAFDNFGRTLKLECTTDEAKCIMDGVTLIKREVFRILEKRGLKQMKTLGEKFDPNLHEAVAMTESAEHKDHEILEEVAPGFTLNDRLIRAAKVRIAMKPKQAEKKEEAKSVEPKAS
ncbi:MAG TPA: nucleotide exchange factor GrpE [Planctomycetota bacterium]|nr:nucleotide exchange factor GrpE [Planctomycetota bacterium]